MYADLRDALKQQKCDQICREVQYKMQRWPLSFRPEFCLGFILLCYSDLDEECRDIRSEIDDLISECHESLSYIWNFTIRFDGKVFGPGSQKRVGCIDFVIWSGNCAIFQQLADSWNWREKSEIRFAIFLFDFRGFWSPLNLI